MKRIVVLLFLAVTTVSAQQLDNVKSLSGKGTIQQWQKLKSEKYGFSIEFPADPSFSQQDVNTAVGAIKMNMYMLDMSNDSSSKNAVYGVIESTYPESYFAEADDAFNENVLNGAIHGGANNVNGTILYKKDIVFNGYPGKEAKIGIDAAFIYFKTYLVENNLYITQVICFPENDGNRDIDRFMDSFELIKIK
jgi:hypothetical protein